MAGRGIVLPRRYTCMHVDNNIMSIAYGTLIFRVFRLLFEFSLLDMHVLHLQLHVSHAVYVFDYHTKCFIISPVHNRPC